MMYLSEHNWNQNTVECLHYLMISSITLYNSTFEQDSMNQDQLAARVYKTQTHIHHELYKTWSRTPDKQEGNSFQSTNLSNPQNR